jgi:hypothetical protein
MAFSKASRSVSHVTTIEAPTILPFFDNLKIPYSAMLDFVARAATDKDTLRSADHEGNDPRERL